LAEEKAVKETQSSGAGATEAPATASGIQQIESSVSRSTWASGVEAKPKQVEVPTENVEQEVELEERTIVVKRVAKVVKGGRRFGFSAIVAVGDKNGRVGIGKGKAREISIAIQKGAAAARKNMFYVPLKGNTIPHEVLCKFGAAKVLLKPASPGTGVIAGGVVRSIVELAGVKDILSKSLGSDNKTNICYATVKGLKSLRTIKQVAEERNISISQIIGKRRSE